MHFFHLHTLKYSRLSFVKAKLLYLFAMQDVLHPTLVRPPSSTTTKPSEPLIPSSSEHGLLKYPLDSMNESEQLELAMKLSKAENETPGSHSGRSLGFDKSPAKRPVASCATEQHTASSHTPVRPRTKMEVRSPTHTAVCDHKTKSDSPNDELEKVLKQSLEEFENMKQKQDHRSNTSNTDTDLAKALELSRLECSQSRNNTMSHKVEQQGDIGGPSDKDEELDKALELSKLEAETMKKEHHCVDITDVHVPLELNQAEVEQSRKKEKMIHEQSTTDTDLQKALELSRVEYKQCETDTVIMSNGEGQREATIIDPTSKHEEDLAKALEISRMDCKHLERNIGNDVLGKATQNGSMKSEVDDDDVAKVLKLSKTECSKPERSIGLQHLDERKEQTSSDLERALELSRIEYTQSNNCSLDGKNEDSDSDIIIMEENVGDVPARKRSVPAQTMKCSSTPMKNSPLIDADVDIVPSSVTSEWDPDPFDALDHATPAGSSKYSAIMLDSQELDDEFLDAPVLQLDDTAKTNRKQLFSSEEENTVDDDFAYALKVQEELNKPAKGPDNHHDSPSKRNTTCLELDDQLTCYRESQKERYGTHSGKGDKSTRGFDFRRNVAAIACGKPVQIGIASPISRPGNSQKRPDSQRVLGDKPFPGSRIDRDKNQGPRKDEAYVIR